jgi:RND family efflux transporter MFP subunit
MTYERSTTIGSFVGHGPAASMLQDLAVRRGDRVKAGQVLGHLFNRDMLAQLTSNEATVAGNKVLVQQREAELSLEKAKLLRVQNIDRRQALLISAQDMQIQQIQVKLAEFAVQKSIQDLRQSEADLGMTTAIIGVRSLTAPHDGVVVEVLQHPGESLSMAHPILRIVDTKHISVTGLLDARDSWRVREGMTVRIFPELGGGKLPIDRDVFPGTVVFVDREIDPETRTCKVVAAIPNEDELLRSGLDCRMEISLNSAATNSPDTRGGESQAADHEAVLPTNGTSTKREGADDRSAGKSLSAGVAPAGGRPATVTRQTSSR